MNCASKPANEFERLKALRRLKILDSLPEDQFDELTYLASYICKTPIALISLVDHSRQWFKSCYGLDIQETPRDISFCAHAILEEDIFLVKDASADLRFSDNPLVTGGPGIKFYAGVPLTTEEGHNIGTLCVLDQTSRELDNEQLKALKALSSQVMKQLELRILLIEAEKLKLSAEEAKRESDEAVSAKASFLANMSHEIRTPVHR